MRLALDAGVFVRADRLVEDLWAADAVNTRRNTLQSKVAKLRRALGDPAADRQRRRRLQARRRAGRGRCARRAARRRRRGRLLDAGDDRGAADLSAAALALLPRGAPARGRRRRLGRPAPGAARRGADDADRDPVLGAAAARRRRRRDRRPGSRRGGVPLPGGPVGAADHGALPGGPPGRRAGGLPAGPGPAGGRARPRARPRLQQLEQQILAPRPGAPRPAPRRRREPAVAVGRAGRPRDGDRRAVPTCSHGERLVEIVGPGGIGKTAVAIATGRSAGRRARRRLAGPARGRDDGGRGPRRADRRAERRGRRGRAVRAAQGAPPRS